MVGCMITDRGLAASRNALCIVLLSIGSGRCAPPGQVVLLEAPGGASVGSAGVGLAQGLVVGDDPRLRSADARLMTLVPS